MKLTKEQYENEIKRQMKILRCSYEEAKSAVDWDLAIDSGDKELGAFTKEQKALIRNLTKADRSPNANKQPVKRERKIDTEKKMLIEKLSETLSEFEEVTVKNEAEINFKIGENSYTVKLTKHRAPKV